MASANEKALQIQQLTGLKPKHFADLIRAAQLVCDPAAGVSGIAVETDWEELGIPLDVADNLQALGQKYRYASPHVPIDLVWEQLSPQTRSWFISNKDRLWEIEEAFPALDED
jgi:hypothetical protein